HGPASLRRPGPPASAHRVPWPRSRQDDGGGESLLRLLLFPASGGLAYCAQGVVGRARAETPLSRGRGVSSPALRAPDLRPEGFTDEAPDRPRRGPDPPRLNSRRMDSSRSSRAKTYFLLALTVALNS